MTPVAVLLSNRGGNSEAGSPSESSGCALRTNVLFEGKVSVSPGQSRRIIASNNVLTPYYLQADHGLQVSGENSLLEVKTMVPQDPPVSRMRSNSCPAICNVAIYLEMKGMREVEPAMVSLCVFPFSASRSGEVVESPFSRHT